MPDTTTPRTIEALKGRLSFFETDAAKAHEEALKGPYRDQALKDGASKPYFNLLLTEARFEQVFVHLRDVFFPFTVEQYKAEKVPPGKTPTGKFSISPKEAQAILDQIEAGDKAPYNTPFSMPTEKTLELYPEAFRVMKMVGFPGQNIEQQAIIRSMADLSVEDPDRVKYPDRLPINQTNHKLYRGCWAMCQVEFFPYRIGPNPNVKANSTVLIFADNAPQFGGGKPLNDDALFAAADE